MCHKRDRIEVETSWRGKTSGYRIRVNNSREGEIRGRSGGSRDRTTPWRDYVLESSCWSCAHVFSIGRVHLVALAKWERDRGGYCAFPCRDKPGKQRFCSPGHVYRAAPSGRVDTDPSTTLSTYLSTYPNVPDSSVWPESSHLLSHTVPVVPSRVRSYFIAWVPSRKFSKDSRPPLSLSLS